MGWSQGGQGAQHHQIEGAAGSGESCSPDDSFEGRYKVGLAQGLFEQPQDSANSIQIDVAPPHAPQVTRVFEIFLSASQYLGDDQILDVDERHDRAADINRSGPCEKLVLQP